MKMKYARNDIAGRLIFAMLPVCLACAPLSAQASSPGVGSEQSSVKFGGYLRSWIGVNLQDTPELGADGNPMGGKGDLSMLRASASLNASGKAGIFNWFGNIRGDVEGMTNYQRRLQSAVRQNSPGGPGSDLQKELSGVELREFYVDTDIGDRVKLRVGKQQIVWGETDFFHPTDVIHGFDYRWRQFFEPESDELRKPLFLVNAKIEVPEVDGSLQVYVRPGLDRKKDIGNSYDLYGGRWMPQPFRGIDFVKLLPYDLENPKGDYKDVTGGIRWSGFNDRFNYALSFATTFQPDPVISPIDNPYMKPASGALGNFIYPKISVVGASISSEITAIDAILNAEVAYQSGLLFNSSTRGLPFDPIANVLNLSGFGPVKEKDIVKTTIRVDKQLRLQEWLGTSQASFSSIQLFDSWVRNFKSEEKLVAFGGYPAPLKEHDTVLTAFIVLNYMNSKLNPMIAVGKNLSTGDAFAIPSISYHYGDHWRFNAEATFFKTKNKPGLPTASYTNSYPLSDFLSNHNQLTLRATYQF